MINFIRTHRFVWMLIFLTSVGWEASAENDAVVPADMAALLERADEMRLPFREGRVRVELLSLKGDRVTGRSAFEVLQSDGGASRVEMLAARVRGQRALLSDHGLWLYVPSSRRVIRLTPLQRLMGNANYGDIGRMRWTDDYKIVKVTRAVNRPRVWAFRLKAKAPTAVYPEVALRLEEETARPLDADFYASSGKLIKSAKYNPPVVLNGRKVIDTITFTGGLGGETRTRMVMGAFKEENLPEYLFTVGGLGK
ncbi:MAG: outer membrane lipoprotein-sorting protein [Desulfatiglandaceae bacterium]